MYDREGELFSAFGGGVCCEDTVVVYGAGNFGRQIYEYAVRKCVRILWVDKRYDFYRKQGMDVRPVEDLRQNHFDHLLIAIIDEETADAVRRNLTEAGIDGAKIKWLDTKRLISEETLHVLGV